jgi:hypothetical protein
MFPMPEHQQTQQSKKTNIIFQKQATPISQTPLSNPYSIIQRAKINPKSLTHADIMQLQRTIGNQAVGRLLSSIGNTSIAQQATVQRQEIPEKEETCPSCIQKQETPEEEEPLQGKMSETFQCQEVPEEEEPLQGKFTETIQRQEIPEEEESLQTKRENNTGMPDNLKVGVENLSGIDMSDVRVHYNSSKPAEVGALAYTQGTDVHVAPRQERHLPHEAWHVVQQAQGRVKPTIQLKNGISVNDDKGLEREANVMGERAFTSGQESIAHELTYHVVQQNGRTVQRSREISLGRMECIQRAPWLNTEARFQTDNGVDNIPKSEYLVSLTDYKRYAPINEIRAPGQVYFEGFRSFAYLPRDTESNAVWYTKIAEKKATSNQVILKNGNETFEAEISPSEGFIVWDGNVDEKGNVSEHHVGHPVTELDKPLPTLDKQDGSEKAKKHQDEMTKKQESGKIANDTLIEYEVRNYAKEKNINYWKALSILKKDKNERDELWERALKIDSEIRNYAKGKNIDYWKALSILKKNEKEFDELRKTALNKQESKCLCFLTTACTKARGLADDCYELTTLRRFRDVYMRSLPEGPALVAEYYDIAPRIVDAIEQQPNAPAILDDLYQRILVSVYLIESNRLSQAMHSYRDMVLDLKGRFLRP